MLEVRRPQRDERWIGPDGDTYQVIEVKTRQEGERFNEKIRKFVAAGKRDLAYFKVRHVETEVEGQVPARNLSEWTRKDPDPLTGMRRQVMERIRAGAGTFTLPAELVFKGELYHLPCGTIRIDKVSKKLVKGQKETEWVVSFTRLMEERLYFLRSVTPKLKPGEKPGEATATEAYRARIDGNYSSTPEAGGDPLPVVHPDWEDKGVAERAKIRIEARSELRAEEEARREAEQVRTYLGRVLKGLTPENRMALLAQIQRDCEQAETKEAA